MKILITAGPTHEPIDAVRYIANRSSGKMGASLAEAAMRAGHIPTLLLGPVTATMPDVRRVDIQTAEQMLQALLREFPSHDLLIMAAAVADYRPIKTISGKIPRQGTLSIECEPTPDLIATASRSKTPAQHVVGFSLENAGDIERAKKKLISKNLDLIVYNPTATMGSDHIEAVLLYPDGRTENLPSRSKSAFADILIQRAVALFSR